MNSRLDNILLRDIYLVVLTIGLSLLMINLIIPFATTLLVALLMAALFQPLFKFLLVKLRSRNLAVFASTLFVLLIVVIPIVLLTISVAGELGAAAELATQFVRNEVLVGRGDSQFYDSINELLASFGIDSRITPADVQNTLLDFVGRATNSVSTIALDLLQNIGGITVQLVVFVIALTMFFRDYDRIPAFIRRYVPLSDDLEDVLYKEFISTGKSLIKGTFLVALLHAVLITIVFFFFNIQGLALLFVALFLSSLVPGGGQIVWVPASIVVALTQGVVTGIALLVISIVIMNIIDTIIRPTLTRGSSKLHPLLSLISILGGLVVYGVGGLLYGPLIAVMFVTIVAAYNKRFKESEKSNAV
jgi:predicted PurR-regulated permease PerM